MVRQIIRNSVKCLACNEEIISEHRHDFVRCPCGNIAVDGGIAYLRRVGGGKPFVDTSLYDDESHVVQRQVIKWGSYGKNGDQPLKRIPIKDMEKDHIMAVLQECSPHKVWKNCMIKELEYREQCELVS